MKSQILKKNDDILRLYRFRMLRLFIFLFLSLIYYSCKKSANNTPNSLNPQSDTVRVDGVLSDKEVIALDELQPKAYTEKDFFLPNGENIYDFLSKNAPELLNTNNLSMNDAALPKSAEYQLNIIRAAMTKKAALLTDKKAQAGNIKAYGSNQPNGLAYVYGANDPSKPKVGLNSKCKEALYGLDCSGLLYQLMSFAKIPFSVATTVENIMILKNWEDLFARIGYPEMQIKKFEYGELLQKDLKAGDIIYWAHSPNDPTPNHVAYVGSVKSELVVFVSNGSQNFNCDENKVPTRGPTQFSIPDAFRKLTNKWGVLRMTTQQIVYSGTTGLPGARATLSTGPSVRILSTIATNAEPDYRADYMAATGLGKKLFFGVGNAILAYDTVSKAWSSEPLNDTRVRWAAAAAGTKVIFAGGMSNLTKDGYTDAVDMYDITTEKWTHNQRLSKARSHLVAAAAGNKIVFAGGDTDGPYVSTVDVFDVSKNNWDAPTNLKVPRRKFAAASTGEIIMFAGGQPAGDGPAATSMVDVYNAKTNTWSSSSLLNPVYGLNGAGAGNYIFFSDGGAKVGQYGYGPVMFDLKQNGYPAQPAPHPFSVAAAAGDFILFGGSGTVDAFNVKTGKWQSIKVRSNLYYSIAASTGKTIMLAGHPLNDTANLDVVTTIDIFNLVEK